jgi:ribosomal protein S18 acetylase RimI-like enzyme
MTTEKVIYREARIEDANQISVLEKEVWGSNAATLANIKNRIETFSSGNVIALSGEKIVGYVCGVIINDETAKNSRTWYEYTDNGNIRGAYDPEGKTFFGVSLTVSNIIRNSGIGSRLLLEIARMAIENNLERGILGGRLPFYYKKKKLPVEKYVELKGQDGKLFDPELRLYCRMGLKIIKLQKDYFKDPESLDYGVILEWKNPFYRLTSAFPFLSRPLSKLFKL